MDNLFWLIPGRLAGRPGPDREPWSVPALREAGIGAVLTVNDGECCEPADFERAGMAHASIPFPGNMPPAPEDDALCAAALPVARAFIENQLEAGRTVMVHCSSGKDRTGLVLGYVLMCRERLSPADTIAAIREVRPIAFSAPGWEDLALRVLGSLEPRS